MSSVRPVATTNFHRRKAKYSQEYFAFRRWKLVVATALTLLIEADAVDLSRRFEPQWRTHSQTLGTLRGECTLWSSYVSNSSEFKRGTRQEGGYDQGRPGCGRSFEARVVTPATNCQDPCVIPIPPTSIPRYATDSVSHSIFENNISQTPPRETVFEGPYRDFTWTVFARAVHVSADQTASPRRNERMRGRLRCVDILCSLKSQR